MIITQPWIETLTSLIDAADLDGAVTHIANVRPNRLDRDLDPKLSKIFRLRARCLICEAYDYAGRREEASQCIEGEAKDLLVDLEAAKRDFETGTWKKTWDNIEALAHLKQKSWACLHLGMVAHYRTLDYTTARERFELVRDVLIRINQVKRHGILATAALARAYYCLGLVEREEHNLYDARKHFSDSIACAWSGIARKSPDHPSIPFLKYSIGRALGLGMAWIAYTRAAMSEATAHIVGARLLLQEVVGVKYLSRYVDIVHGCAERSRAEHVVEIERAIEEMLKAYDQLGGQKILDTGEGIGHLVYAQRAAYELATAHIGASRVYKREMKRLETDMEVAQAEREEALVIDRDAEAAQKRDALNMNIAFATERRESHLNAAMGHISAVEKSLQWTDPKERDKRTRCNISITKSRVFRERGEFDPAFSQAKAALEVGRDHLLSRIDCWITLGELYYHRSEHERALKEFEKARKDRRAQTNPKILAVCDLQIALCYLKGKQGDVAQKIFTDWENRGSQGRSNAFVRHLAQDVKQQLSEAAFVIGSDVADKDLQRVLDRAQLWLIDLAKRRHKGERGVDDTVGSFFNLGGRGLKERIKALKKRLDD